jgi:hypothetical protein
VPACPPRRCARHHSRDDHGLQADGGRAVRLTAVPEGRQRFLDLSQVLEREEEIVTWWNFVGRSHDDIARAREEWEASSDRFGEVAGCPGDRLPAPALPIATITPRRNPPRH